MRLGLTGRHITITPAIRTLVERRLATVLRLLNDSAVSAQVVLIKEKTQLRAEVSLHARGENFLHGNGSGRDVGAALGAATDKIDRQAQRVKGKWQSRKRRGVSKDAGVEAQPPAPSREIRVVRARRYPVVLMSVEEAALQFGGSGDAFLVFRNLVRDTVSVLFRRPDGHLGLIEPEA
jgi:putative sigma-54 modulation protein